ncbi:RTA1 like protein [Mycena metata]|uniref:RTA1 like protein n=1 Tax=Mycena metata TaxID=1033252 RepID=A0AAD7I289_9AGAR|nr:RTA1 like protein [Mycena metata]
MSHPVAELLSTISSLTLRDDVPDSDSLYGYKPTEAVAILFITLYGISTILHIGQAICYRTWWLLPTAALCGIGELLGWSGRLWISTTILAPTPLLAASFIIVGRVIQRLGPQYSRLTPKWCTYSQTFRISDLIALVVQGVGGGMASSADDLAGANVGAHVMLGGIVFQLVVIILFSALMFDFVYRYLRDLPVRVGSTAPGALTLRLKIMLAGVAFSTTTLFIRSVYRTIELSGGWNGRIIETEVYFNVLDGGMVVLAIFTLNFAHPGFLFKQAPTEGKDVELKSRDSA